MRHTVELLDDRLVQLAPVVAVHVEPQRRVTVEVLVPVDVVEPHALRPRHDQRLVGEELLHLRKGVPEVAPILVEQLLVAAGAGRLEPCLDLRAAHGCRRYCAEAAAATRPELFTYLHLAAMPRMSEASGSIRPPTEPEGVAR